ncbi:MAG: glycosyltransferase family 2 protein, partial [Planctomycetes bacterium]|nr:glycosyltransferase family 2 protein [Planctomycetota bacterium]
FSRNFGHEAASTAGLDQARGEAVVLMDADLQDPPELIPEMVARWREGYHVVYAQRKRRAGESWFKRTTAWAFYRLLNSLTQVAVPADTGDFRLMDHRVVADFRRLREQHRFVRGMIAWLGYRQTAIQFDRPSRMGGDPKYGPLKLAALSLDAIMGFSTVPLRIATAFGLLTLVGSICAGGAVLVHKVVWGIPLPGYALLTCGIFFIGGVQMLLLGIVGEYIGRIYTQVQQRPLYVVQEQSSLHTHSPSIFDPSPLSSHAATIESEWVSQPAAVVSDA